VTANASKADVPLRRNHDFAWLWAGQTVSMAGSAVSFIGLPLSAVLLLHVDALRLGFISALELLPNVVVSPFAGHLVDRYSRHRLLLLADIGRFAILGVLPLFYFTVGLQYWMMPVAALIVGMLTSLFEISFLAFLPSLVPISCVSLVSATNQTQGRPRHAALLGTTPTPVYRNAGQLPGDDHGRFQCSAR
jgi:MFS family permease